MTEYGYDRNIAAQVRDDMTKVKNHLVNELNNLPGMVDPLTQDWDGPSKQAYNEARQLWVQAAQRMPFTLQSANTALTRIEEEYLRVERAGVQSFGDYRAP
ncbi:WXG100 family type VII secretion target [Actinosynnema sp. NPDC053489]|uniref:WXG100 family type VII secretion target n=1 Tax=Actinosynnema sp. NPDC053489 TaxID=3363916 RepID=UPI0037CC1EE0